ncbi:type I-E CRISPR-associated protein Cse1/CasA [Apilactobacillus micheneri]|uniref:type I-E CRISPR-associated protein Cse1/CasA n=1 Tax=Apilactobacillus micheneri TaxID=1899430 RepID=UPI0015E86A6B|nr:type I-E CRISPR-associated protein Cse1/CasA [Apilactobacillus micheneri]
MNKIHRYNLLNESWLNVIDSNNDIQKVSLLDIFKDAHEYKRLANDTSAQDFAILRLLLSILETTFSRYDYNGQKKDVSLINNWINIWQKGKFSFEVVQTYLLSQKDKFYLYDDKYPFLQVSKKDLDDHGIKKTGTINGKLINRLISESNNKEDLFTPSTNKNKLTNDSLARWLLAFQSYSGTSDKAKYPNMKASASKGWLLGLGGIYVEGDNLFKTLMLNLMPNEQANQKPIWESDFNDKLHLEANYAPDNLSELYTNCSRLLYINPNTDLNKEDVQIEAVQLPGMDKDIANGIEPMTLFQKPKSGTNKGKIIPKMHEMNKSLWRNFGLLEGLSDDNKDTIPKPGVISDLYDKPKIDNINTSDITIVAVGMTYNHDASSMPNGEICDSLNIKRETFNDISKNGRVAQINVESKNTQKAVGIFKYFIQNVMNIRNVSNPDLVNKFIEEVYFSIDEPFKLWISSINNETDMKRYPFEWRMKLNSMLIDKAEEFMYPLSPRDLVGEMNAKTNSMENVITKYDLFRHSLKNHLNLKK